MNIEEAIKALRLMEHVESIVATYEPGEAGSNTTVRELKEACRMGADALRALPPNTPLTLEEFRDMDGEPVFLMPLRLVCIDDERGAWALIDLNQRMCRVSGGGLAVFENCGKTWLAYRRRPKEDAT